ncbi:hypothetical protein L195_g053366, partial [Trifolium pratense]
SSSSEKHHRLARTAACSASVCCSFPYPTILDHRGVSWKLILGDRPSLKSFVNSGLGMSSVDAFKVGGLKLIMQKRSARL